MMNKIVNLTGRLVILRLNSGETLFIDPGTTSTGIPDVELRKNTMIKKLRDRGVINVHQHHAAKQHPSKRPKKESPAFSTVVGREEPDKKDEKKQIKSKTKGGK